MDCEVKGKLADTTQKMKFSIPYFFSKCDQTNPQFPADLVTFTEEIHNGKLHFLCSVKRKQKETTRENFNFVACEELPKSKTQNLPPNMLQGESYPSECKSLLLNDNVHTLVLFIPLSPTLNNQS